ncbi:MAG: MFS transporter [Eubacteriales bacterium]|nr:MFS transporter [Eubacteriales bacterium]
MKLLNRRLPVVFAICYTSYSIVYIARLSMTMGISPLIEMGFLTKSQAGITGTVFCCVFAMGRLVNGALGDHFRPRRFLATGLMIIGISNILLGAFPIPPVIAILWGFNAFGQSMLWGSILKIMSGNRSVENAERNTSIMVTSTAVGSMLGVLLALFAIEKISVQAAFIIPGLMALIASISVNKGVRDDPTQTSQKQSVIRAFSSAELFRNRNFLRVIIPAALHGAIKDNLTLWMAVFFTERYAMDLPKTTLYVIAIPLTGLFGRLLFMPLYKLCRRNLTLTTAISFGICMLTGAAVTIRGIDPGLSAVCLSIMSAAIMMVNTSLLSIYPMRFISTNQVSKVSGILDFFTYLGAGAGSLILAFI